MTHCAPTRRPAASSVAPAMSAALLTFSRTDPRRASRLRTDRLSSRSCSAASGLRRGGCLIESSSAIPEMLGEGDDGNAVLRGGCWSRMGRADRS